MRLMKSLLKSIMIGLGFGSFFFLVIGIFFNESMTLVFTPLNFFGVLIMSALIGLYSAFLFSDQFKPLLATVIHFFLVYVTVLTPYRLLDWGDGLLSFTVICIIIYLVVWFTLSYFLSKEINEVNIKLIEKKRNH